MRLRMEHEEAAIKLSSQNQDFEQLSTEFEILLEEKQKLEATCSSLTSKNMSLEASNRDMNNLLDAKHSEIDMLTEKLEVQDLELKEIFEGKSKHFNPKKDDEAYTLGLQDLKEKQIIFEDEKEQFEIQKQELHERVEYAEKRIQNLEKVVIREREKRKEAENQNIELREVKKINEQLIAKSSFLEGELRNKRSDSMSKSNTRRQQSIGSRVVHNRNGSVDGSVLAHPAERQGSQDRQERSKRKRKPSKETSYDDLAQFAKRAEVVEFSRSSPNTGGFQMNQRSFGDIFQAGRNYKNSPGYDQNSKMHEYNEELIRRMMMPESSKSKNKSKNEKKTMKKSSQFKKKTGRKSSRRKFEMEQKLQEENIKLREVLLSNHKDHKKQINLIKDTVKNLILS